MIATDLDCQPGDEVELLLPESSLVRASLLIYGLPLFAMVLAGFLATVSFNTDWLVVLLTIGGFAIGVGIATLCANRLEHQAMAPYIRSVRALSERPSST